MAEPFETLIYVARLTQAEKNAVFAHDMVFPNSGLKNQLFAAINDVCADR